MRTFLFIILAILEGAVAGNYFKEGSSFPADYEERQKNRECLLDGGDKSIDSSDRSDNRSPKPTTQVSVSSSTYGQCVCSCENPGSGDNMNPGDEDHDDHSGDGSGSGSSSSRFEYDDYCVLFQYFYNISIEIAEISIRQAWIEFIEELQIDIIYDKILSYDEKLVVIWAKIEEFVEIHEEIKELIYYAYIDEWNGYISDIKAAVIAIQYQYSATVIEFNAAGSCSLFEALRNCSGVDGEYSARIESLIKELDVIIHSSSYSYSYQFVLIYWQIHDFFVQYSQYESSILKVEIEGYGPFSSFFNVANTYWRIYHSELVVDGAAAECAVIKALTACYKNSSIESASQRGQIKQLVAKIVNYFEAHVEKEVRVDYFVTQLYEFFILQEWSFQTIYSVQIEGYGSFSDILVSWGFYKSCGCVDFNSPSSTQGIDESTGWSSSIQYIDGKN